MGSLYVYASSALGELGVFHLLTSIGSAYSEVIAGRVGEAGTAVSGDGGGLPAEGKASLAGLFTLDVPVEEGGLHGWQANKSRSFSSNSAFGVCGGAPGRVDIAAEKLTSPSVPARLAKDKSAPVTWCYVIQAKICQDAEFTSCTWHSFR